MAAGLRAGRHWAVAVSVAAHAALVGALVARLGPAPPTAAMPRIEIEFAATPAPEPAPPMPEAAPEPPPIELPPPEPPPPVAFEPPEPAPPEPVIAEAPPEPELIATTAPEAPAEAPPLPHRKPMPPRERRQVAARPPEPPRPELPRAEPAKVAPQRAEAPQVARAPAAPAPVPAGPPPDYLALLQSKLQRSLEYPRSARQAGIQGFPVLWFALDGAGRLIEWRLVRSSGHEQLDREAEATLRRAAPFPPPPPSYGGRMEVQVPVAFRLR